MKTSIITNYSFDKAAQTVTLTDFSSIELNRILSITDMTNGIQVYTYRNPQYTGTIATNVLTLKYNTNNDLFSNSDKLYIEYITDNYSNQLKESSSHTESFNSSDITNYNSIGASFIFNVTAVSGTTPILTAKVQVKDSVSGNYIDIPGAITAEITVIGTHMLTVYPGLTASANSKVDFPMPRIYRIAYAISGTTPSFTFSSVVNYLN